MKHFYAIIFFWFISISASPNTDSLIIHISDVSGEKVRNEVVTAFAQLGGVIPVSYCEGLNVLFVIVDRNAHPNNNAISSTLTSIYGGRLTFTIKPIDGSGYSEFRDGCSTKMIFINVLTPTDQNSHH